MTDSSERRSAFVSIDVVAYTTMVATDLLGAARAIRYIDERVVTPQIAHWGGGLIARAGDSWLVEFPTALAAVRFSLSVQENLHREPVTPLRVGIHVGEVAWDGAMLHGNGINIAVRLQGIARPGGITFSSAVHEELPSDLGCEIRDIGPRLMKNIPDPVRVYRIVMSGEEDEPTAVRSSAIDLSRQVPGLDRRPAIAVIPFENVQGGREYEFFSDGLTEDIINGLCRLRWLPVISRNSTFRFRQSLTDIRDIGSQLGASYIVSGSVDVSDRLLRVQVGLTETETRRLLWTERYQGRIDDLFALRDEIARGIVGTIEPEFLRAEQLRSRAQRLESLDNWALVRRGVWHMNQLTRDDARTARELFERALADDSASVEALIHLSWWHFWDVWVRRGPMEGWIEMARLARRAMSLDPQDARPVMLTGISDFMQGEPERGRRVLIRATHMNPSLAVAHASIGSTHILSGEPERAIEPLQTALRLSPNDFYIFHTLGEVAVARYMMGDYNLAVAAAEEALQFRSGYVHAHVVRIGSLARSGRLQEAKAALWELRTRRPEFKPTDIEWLPFIDRQWITYLAGGLALAEEPALENDEGKGRRNGQSSDKVKLV